MAKDPAFLFYPGDWLGGTTTLTRHQKGCYVDLLMAQFNAGPLSMSEIKTVLGQDYAVFAEVLIKKFEMTGDGKYYNERLKYEIEKRKAYSESRRANKQKKSYHNTYDISHDNDMSEHMENAIENRNEIKNEKGGAGGESDATYYPKPNEKKSNNPFNIIENGYHNFQVEIILKNNGFAPDRAKDIFQAFADKRMSLDEYFDQKQMLHKFSTFCRTWRSNELIAANTGFKKVEKPMTKRDQLLLEINE